MANYYVLLTDHGRSFIADAQAGTQLALTHVVLGDANNQPYLPESRLDKTKLLHQTAKLPITSINVVSATTAEVTTVVPSNVGGFNLHEVGIADSSGKLVYVGNFHGGYRPTLTEGAGGDMELIFTITADNLANVVITVDGSIVSATRDWVDERFRVLINAMIPFGYKYWSHSPDDPKPLFDELLGIETFWRRLEGMQLVSVKDGSPIIGESGMVAGNEPLTATDNANPDNATHYTSYLWERYDPDAPIRHNGISRRNGIHKYK